MRRNNFKKNNLFFSLFSSSRIIAVFGIFLIAMVIYPLVNKINKQTTIDQEIKELAAEIDEVNNKNNELREVINYLESSQFIEKEARLSLDMKKTGENVVIIKDNEKKEEDEKLGSVFSIPGLNKEKDVEKITNPDRWLDYFFTIK